MTEESIKRDFAAEQLEILNLVAAGKVTVTGNRLLAALGRVACGAASPAGPLSAWTKAPPAGPFTDPV